MKKAVAITLGVIVIAAAYPTSAWIIGQQIETRLQEDDARLEKTLFLKLVKRDYQRGLFSASSTETIEIDRAMFLSLYGGQQAANDMPALEPLQISFRSEIKHGPFPGFSAFAAALVDTELVIDESIQTSVAKIFNGQKPFAMHTRFGFDGGGIFTMSSPALTHTFDADESGQALTVSSDGLTISGNFARKLAQYDVRFDFPRAEFSANTGQVSFSGLRLDAQQKRPMEEFADFYLGTTKVSIDNLAVKIASKETPLLIDALAYEVATPANGEFIDIITKLSAQKVQLGEKVESTESAEKVESVEKTENAEKSEKPANTYGPLNYDISARHLHTRTLAEAMQSLTEDSARPEWRAEVAKDPQKAFAGLAKPGLALLNQNPEIRIDEIRLKTDQGDLWLTAFAKLDEGKELPAFIPLLLVSRLNAGAEMNVSESLFGEAHSSRVNFFVKEGFAERENGQIKSKLNFTQGQITLNGKPFNPLVAMRQMYEADTE